MREAEEAASPSDLPVACVRRHGGEDVVVMRPETFAVLLQSTATDFVCWEEARIPW